MTRQKSVPRKPRKRSPGKVPKGGQAPPAVQQHKDSIVEALINKAEEGNCAAANVLVKHGGLSLSEPGDAKSESDLAGLLLEQFRIEQQKSQDEPAPAEAPALK